MSPRPLPLQHSPKPLIPILPRQTRYFVNPQKPFSIGQRMYAGKTVFNFWSPITPSTLSFLITALLFSILSVCYENEKPPDGRLFNALLSADGARVTKSFLIRFCIFKGFVLKTPPRRAHVNARARYHPFRLNLISFVSQIRRRQFHENMFYGF